MGFPQIIWLVITTLSLGFTLAKDGERTKISFGWAAVGTLINVGLLYWGGFFS